MSLLTIPMNVAKKLEAIQCKFIWEDIEKYLKYHLIAWSELKKPIALGGLGIRSLVEWLQLSTIWLTRGNLQG